MAEVFVVRLRDVVKLLEVAGNVPDTVAVFVARLMDVISILCFKVGIA